ncbi:MAG: hypothetical protein NXY57DRAFT_217332 [Lentinula lateritia]|nr:MAG: hypothetical protein NXY57DRAFT_217332 [Lentinula lateritia]
MDMIILHLIFHPLLAKGYLFSLAICLLYFRSCLFLYLCFVSPSNRFSKMRFISVYLFLALVSVGFAVPLSAEKDTDRSLEARSNSGPNSGPSKPNRGNFYDDPDDGPNGITMEEALRRQQVKKNRAGQAG